MPPDYRPERALAWLHDVGAACDAIARILPAEGALDLDRHSLLRAAIERHLHIAGEACVRLRDHAPEIAARLPELRQVIGLRNVLAHLYDVIDPVRFEHIARHEVPVLKAHVEAVIAEFREDPRYRDY